MPSKWLLIFDSFGRDIRLAGGALSDKTRSDCGRGPVIIIKFKNDKLILSVHLPESVEVCRERWV